MFRVGRCLIRDRRKAKGWTQLQLEKRSGIRYQHISEYERNIVTPEVHTLKAIAYALDCNIDDLYEWIKIDNESVTGE